MPDLGVPRYAIPEVNAQGELTGRTLVCPDRKRIMTTTCVSVCEFCDPFATEYYDAVLHGVELCGCRRIGERTWEEFDVVEGILNEEPHRMRSYYATPVGCKWQSDYVLRLRRREYYSILPCDGTPQTEIHRVRFELVITTIPSVWLTGYTDEGYAVLFHGRGVLQYGNAPHFWDCQDIPLLDNEADITPVR